MARLYGREWSRRELLERVGDITQIAGTRRSQLTEGPEKGVEQIEFRTGTGFSFVVSPSRGMDITYAEYRGAPLCWRSATGEAHPATYEPEGLGWLRGFYGGLMATCGLTQAGAPSTDDGQELGLHGRINYTAARNVYHDGDWDGDDYIMWAYGRVREAVVFGENVRLTRRIWARMGENRLFINDLVENMGSERVPHMIAYHINPGFPVIDHDARLVSTTLTYRPRDEDAQMGQEYYAQFHVPLRAYREKVYYHDLKADDDGYAYCASINHNFPDGGIGLYVRHMIGQLPYLWEWKMMGEGTYVVGMEPANCLPEGRDRERARGALRYLEPGEVQEYTVEIGVLAGQGDIAEYEERVRAILYVPPIEEPVEPTEAATEEPVVEEAETGAPETAAVAALAEATTETATADATPPPSDSAPATDAGHETVAAVVETATDDEARATETTVAGAETGDVVIQRSGEDLPPEQESSAEKIEETVQEAMAAPEPEAKPLMDEGTPVSVAETEPAAEATPVTESSPTTEIVVETGRGLPAEQESSAEKIEEIVESATAANAPAGADETPVTGKEAEPVVDETGQDLPPEQESSAEKIEETVDEAMADTAEPARADQASEDASRRRPRSPRRRAPKADDDGAT